ncbi:stage II sporulation protein P [Lysinibacillus composti]|uniref:Stage II sporulation protein P n=1 Tax=Lysinibacillus composti TaxID=720633 RepID=A0A3N9ULG2_9BACI|nr:stage II sporulation protein P [Lysinibacillus composti]MBM7607300.1 stage II sporulation protein P [Lysinibacillus composti]RQW76128.1 stage II sporulation protein P [Lysinibacillus composti]
MPKKLIFFLGFISMLFLSPIIVSSLSTEYQNKVLEEQPAPKKPINASTANAQPPIVQPDSNELVVDKKLTSQKLVYAPTTKDESTNSIEQAEAKEVLMLFTHSHEAFIPMVKSENGESAVYHSSSNITEFEEIIKKHFNLNSLNTKFLGVDTMDELKKTNRTFSEAYNVVRPFLSTELQKNNYDLVVDLHRDSAKREISTLNYKNQSYGKLYFVVGEDHRDYSKNQSYAQQISDQLNELVPGISRGVIGKKGEHVDGIYNQDLANNMVLIELGGIENTQEEINRTISVLAKAIAMVLKNSSTQ